MEGRQLWTAFFEAVGLPTDHRLESREQMEELIRRTLGRYLYSNIEILSLTNPEARLFPVEPFAAFAYLEQTRYGFCFQVLEVVFQVLREKGVACSRHVALPVNLPCDDNLPDDAILLARPHSHEVIVVRIQNEDYLLDVGYGPGSLQGLLPLKQLNRELHLGDSTYRLTALQSDSKWRRLDLQMPDDSWRSLYIWTTDLLPDADVERLNRDLYDKSLVPLGVRDSYLYFASCFPERKSAKLFVDEPNYVLTRRANGELKEERTLTDALFMETDFGIPRQTRVDKIFRK